MKRNLSLLLCGMSISVSVLFCGCMAVRGPAFTDLTAVYSQGAIQPPESKLRVQVLLNAKHWANGQIAESPTSAITKERYNRVLDTVLSRQHMFAAIGTSVSNADWTVMCDIREEERYSQVGVICCGATLGLCPAVARVEMGCKATVYDKEGAVLAKLDAKQDVKLIMHILFLLPWRSGLFDEAQQNLVKDVLLQFRELAAKKG
jgi:hypothetical protein